MSNSQPNNKEEKKDTNVIYVGGKPLVNYVRGVMVQFKREGTKEVIVRSRGKFISKAVDVAEIVKRTMVEDKVFVKSVEIASESFETEGRKTNISTMDITLGKL